METIQTILHILMAIGFIMGSIMGIWYLAKGLHEAWQDIKNERK